jgi:HEAT repeat protein
MDYEKLAIDLISDRLEKIEVSLLIADLIKKPNPDSVRFLLYALKRNDHLIRSQAATALGKLPDLTSTAIDNISNALFYEKVEHVREKLVDTLIAIGGNNAMSGLIPLLDGADRKDDLPLPLMKKISNAIVSNKYTRGLDYVYALLYRPVGYDIWDNAVKTIEKSASFLSYGALLDFLEGALITKYSEARRLVVEALKRINTPAARDILDDYSYLIEK